MRQVTCGWVTTYWKNRKPSNIFLLEFLTRGGPDSRITATSKSWQTNQESEDIFMEDVIGTHYSKKPNSLDDLCLHDFVPNYDWLKKDSDDKRVYRKLTKPRIVNHKLFDPQKEHQRKDYLFSLLLIFVPFRSEASLLQENETAENAFGHLLPAHGNCSAYHARLQAMLKVQQKLKAISDARKSDVADEEPSRELENDPQLLGEAKSAMQDVHDMKDKSDDLTLDDRVKMLNDDQRQIFDNIKAHLLHQIKHDSGQCSCTLQPLRMFVSGVGGTRKSFLIHAVMCLIDSLLPTDDISCAIAAPTGLAAFNVGGVTIHRLFQLPIEHEGKQAGYWSLSKAAQKVMRSTFRSLKMIIVDEVSIVSSLNLAYMHLRLEELFGGHDWFGGRNVLFVGDLLQLQPVNGSPVFEKITKTSLCLKLGCAASINIWTDSVVYDELTINERQKKDENFSKMLGCVRRGAPTEETLHTLEKRVIKVSVPEIFSELQKEGKVPVCLFPTRKQCNQLNE